MRRGLGIVAASAALGVFVCVSSLAMGQPAGDGRVRYDGHKIVRVQIDSQRDLLAMQQFSQDTWVCGAIRRGPVEFRVAPEMLGAMDEAGIEYEVVVPDVQALIDAEAAGIAAAAQLRGLDYFSTYRSYAEISAYVDTLVALRPDLATRFVAGQSLEGRDIFGIRITSPVGGSEKPALFLHGLIHAREWITGSAVMYIADRLVRDYGVDPAMTSMLDTFEVIIVPITNPDGYVYTWTNDRLWRKNRRPNANGSFGVDNNRNWGFGWGGPGASTQPANETYRGTGPFSEPETQVLRDFILANPRIVATLDIHSFSQLILSPWGFTDQQPADASLFNAINAAVEQAMEAVDSRDYTAGPTYATIYPASGVGQDWSYGSRQTLGWGFELRPATSQQGGFILPAAQIIPASRECLAGVQAIAEYLRDNAVYFGFPEGAPVSLPANANVMLLFEARRGRLQVDGAATRFYWRRGRSGPFTPAMLTHLGNKVAWANMTTGPCGSVVQFYIETRTTGGATFTFPAEGAAAPIEVPVLESTIVFADGFESPGGWIAGLPGDTATSGQWVRGDPIGTTAQPEDAYAGTNCYFTGQGPVGGQPGAADVDDGFTTLLSPRFSLAGAEGATVSYYRWYSNVAGAAPASDVFTISISNDDGQTWTTLETVGPGGPGNAGGWIGVSLPLPAGMTPTANMRVRFVAADEGEGSLVEAAVDEFLVTAMGCPGPACLGDWDRDGVVNSGDISFFLTGWLHDVQTGGTGADFDGSGQTNSNDISAFLNEWLASVAQCG